MCFKCCFCGLTEVYLLETGSSGSCWAPPLFEWEVLERDQSLLTFSPRNMGEDGKDKVSVCSVVPLPDSEGIKK